MEGKLIDMLYEYPIQSVVEITELTKGNTSSPRLITTTDNTYILRKIKDTKQATTEFLISNTLFAYNIAPKMLETKRGALYVRKDERTYNLQQYIEHTDEQPINFEALGRTISIFHEVIRSVEGIHEQQDRFSLPVMWKELVQMNTEISSDLRRAVELCLTYKQEPTGYIHGDLGKWNLLFTEKDVYIIDFGEVRSGNYHFDIAAVITSIIDWQRDDNWIIDALYQFKEGYVTIEWKMLKESIDLWLVQGIVAMFVQHGITPQTKKYEKLLMDRRERLEIILNV